MKSEQRNRLAALMIPSRLHAILSERGIFELATLALNNADRALAKYMRTTPMNEHPATVQKMKEQIATIINELRIGVA